jgi:hypothetical protein
MNASSQNQSSDITAFGDERTASIDMMHKSVELDCPWVCRGGTPHRLARGFHCRQLGVEDSAGFQHGAGHVEQAVGD